MKVLAILLKRFQDINMVVLCAYEYLLIFYTLKAKMENFPQHQSHMTPIFFRQVINLLKRRKKGDKALAQWKYTKDEPKRKRIKRSTVYNLSKIQVI